MMQNDKKLNKERKWSVCWPVFKYTAAQGVELFLPDDLPATIVVGSLILCRTSHVVIKISNCSSVIIIMNPHLGHQPIRERVEVT